MYQTQTSYYPYAAFMVGKPSTMSTIGSFPVGIASGFVYRNGGLVSVAKEDGVYFRGDLGYIYFKLPLSELDDFSVQSVITWLNNNNIDIVFALQTPEIIDLPHLNKKLTLPTQPDTLPIGYKVENTKSNPQLGLTIPYKQLNYPSRPQNIDFKMDIADYVLTWDDVKEARQYNVILNDRVIATVK